ncbi:MAG: hypothetical protein ACRD1I_08665 [Terriglobia bacterium]
MLLKLNEPLQIEDLRNYPAEAARRLRELLLRGVLASPDLQRKNFYDVEDGCQVFYIHISPTGKVLLLAMWAKEGAPLHAPAATHLAHQISAA